MHTNTRYLLWYSSLNPSLWVRCAHTALQALVLPLGSTGGLALHSQALLLLAFAQVISSFRNVLCSPDEFSLLEALPNCPKQRVLLHLLWFCVFLSPQITWDHFQLPWPLLWPQFQHTKRWWLWVISRERLSTKHTQSVLFVMDWIVSPQNAYTVVLTPSAAECDFIWK